MQALNIPYRVVVNSGGDLGLGQVKKYDIEGWVPSEKKYRETSFPLHISMISKHDDLILNTKMKMAN